VRNDTAQGYSYPAHCILVLVLCAAQEHGAAKAVCGEPTVPKRNHLQSASATFPGILKFKEVHPAKSNVTMYEPNLGVPGYHSVMQLLCNSAEHQ